MSVDFSTQKLIAMAVLDDDIGALLSPKAGDTFWRGFLIQERATGEYAFLYRFEYTDEACWVRLTFREQRPSLEALLEELKQKFGEVILGIARKHLPGLKLAPDAFQWFVVPEADREDSGRTMIWLEMQDLVNPPRFEKLEVPDGK